MTPEHQALAAQLLALETEGVLCTITLRECGSERQIVARISSVSDESVVLHETATGAIDVYPIDNVVSAVAAPTGHHHRTGRRHHAGNEWQEMLIRL